MATKHVSNIRRAHDGESFLPGIVIILLFVSLMVYNAWPRDPEFVCVTNDVMQTAEVCGYRTN